MERAAALGRAVLLSDPQADAQARAATIQAFAPPPPAMQQQQLEIQPLEYNNLPDARIDDLYVAALATRQIGVQDEEDDVVAWPTDMNPYTLGQRIDAEKSDKYLFNQPVAVAAKPCVLSYTVRASDRFKLLNFWMASRGQRMDSDLVGVKKLADLMEQLAEPATRGHFNDLLLIHANNRIVLLPCATAYSSKQDVVDHHYRDAFRDARVGSIVVLQTVDDRTGACVMFGIGVVVEKAMVNDQAVHAFADRNDSSIFLPVMILARLDENPFDAQGGACFACFAEGHDRGEVMTKICVSQSPVDHRSLPSPLSVWITENALRDAGEAIRTRGDDAVWQSVRGRMATETRRAMLLRSLATAPGNAEALKPLRHLFDLPPEQRALDCKQCFAPTGGPPKKNKRNTDSAKEVVGKMVTAYKRRRVTHWGPS